MSFIFFLFPKELVVSFSKMHLFLFWITGTNRRFLVLSISGNKWRRLHLFTKAQTVFSSLRVGRVLWINFPLNFQALEILYGLQECLEKYWRFVLAVKKKKKIPEVAKTLSFHTICDICRDVELQEADVLLNTDPRSFNYWHKMCLDSILTVQPGQYRSLGD